MKQTRICFIAQFPPPLHGLSQAVDTLYHSGLQKEFALERVNITDNRRFPENLFRIFRSRADLFYLTISQTRGGNLRDILILKLLCLLHRDCLVHLHGGYYRQMVEQELPAWQRKANYKLFGRLRGAIVLSDSFRSLFQGILPDKKIYSVANCVDDDFLLREEEWKEKLAGLKHRRLIHVLYLSNFIRTKGYPRVLELAGMEKKRVEAGEARHFHFDFAGEFFDEKEKNFFERAVRDNGLEDIVTYHGAVTGEGKRSLLRICDIFVLLTKYPREGQPISILEAMGSGMTIVTTAHAGIPDIVRDGVNGIVEEEGLPAAVIYDRMMGYSTEKLAATGEYNRRYCLEKFTQKQYVDAMGEIFRKVSNGI